MDVDSVLLSRFQFAWVVAFHILLPAFTVGLSCYIATLEFNWWITKRDVYRRLSAFWLKIFAVSFGMGVVSGIVMPFQFGLPLQRTRGASHHRRCERRRRRLRDLRTQSPSTSSIT